MADAATLLNIQNGIATITLNRPKEKNSLGGPMLNSLCDNMKACMGNDQVRVIVLTNAGNTFCAGANLKGGQEAPRYNLTDLFDMMHQGPKPVVGRISGHCTGGGVGIAAACDISVIPDNCELGFTEVRIGVAPAIISVVCLPKMCRADAAELMLSGEKVSAKRAVETRLLNYVVPAKDLDAKVDEVVGKLLRGGPNAMAATKGLVYKVPSMQVDEAFKWTADISAKFFQSDEAKEGIQAFAQKRDAAWVPKSKL